MPKPGEYAYWLSVVEQRPGVTILQAEAGYKPCAHPGQYRVWLGQRGPNCPGCDRSCRIPASANLMRGDEIYVLAPAKSAKGKTR